MASPQELEADFFGLSTLGPVADYGKGLNRRIEAQQKRRDRPLQNLGKGLMLGPGGEVTKIPEYAEVIAEERKHAVDLINQRLTTSKEGRDLEFQRKKDLLDYKAGIDSADEADDIPKLGSSEKKKLAENQALINQGAVALQMLKDNPDAIEQFYDLPTFWLRDSGWLAGANIVESWAKTPDELKTINMLKKAGADIKRSLSGAAFTVMEKALGTAFQFDAPGISSEEAQRRFETFISYYRENQAMLLKVTGQDPNLMEGEQISPEVVPQAVEQPNYQDERAKRKAELNRLLQTN